MKNLAESLAAGGLYLSLAIILKHNVFGYWWVCSLIMAIFIFSIAASLFSKEVKKA